MNLPKCPYLVINIPGERPFVMERKQYESVTKGITIVETTLTKEDIYIDKIQRGEIVKMGAMKGVWVYTVKHETLLRTGRRARGSTRFFNLLQTRYAGTFWKFHNEMVEYGEKYLAATQPKPSKHERAIARLEKQLVKAKRWEQVDDIASLTSQIESLKELQAA